MAVDTRIDVRPETPSAASATNGHGHFPGRLRRARPRQRRRWWIPLGAVVAVAAGLAGVEVAAVTPTYPVDAVFASAPGLFSGAAVEVLGVQVGTVSSVRNVGDVVQVVLGIDQGRPIPSRATASLVSPELLGEPAIELAPGYTGGPAMRAGTVIPESRTSVPVSTEQLLKSLEQTLEKINPAAVGSLVTNLAQDLTGQGQGLNTLIHGAAGTLQLLATKADDLGQLSGSLAQLTGALDGRTAQITQLITDYDTVSGVIAQHATQLGGAITQLSQASTQIVQLLVPDLSTVESDVGQVTSVGRTLDRNLTSVDEIFSSATALFSAAKLAYTATHDWLNLNLQTPVGVTGAYLAGLVRDRLAGVCRRIAANHSSGLSASQLQTLASCGNPASGYFDPIIGEIPTILNDITNGQVPTTSPAQMLQQGLTTIPGLPASATTPPAPTTPTAPTTPAATTAPTTTPTSTPTCPPVSTSSSSTTTTTKPTLVPTTTTTSTTVPPGCPSTTPTTVPAPAPVLPTPTSPLTCLGGLLGGLVPCGPSSPTSSSGSSSSGSSSTGSGSTGSGGLSGLLSYDVPVDGGAPSLSTAAERMLPALPSGAPGASVSRAVHRTGRRGKQR